MKVDKISLFVALSALIGLIVSWALPTSKEWRPINPALNAEAHANSPECLGLPDGIADPAQIDTEKIYTKKELETEEAVSRKCWEAKVRYISTMKK